MLLLLESSLPNALQTLVFEMFGVCGLLVQTVVLRYMLKWLGEARMLTFGLTAALLEMLLVAFINAKWQVGAAAQLGSTAAMIYPIPICAGV